jgi:Ca2+-transporting ATPase
MSTQLGLIATMLQSVETEETPLQRRLDQLGKSLSIGSLLLVFVVFIVALFNYTEVSSLFSNPINYFKTFAEQITEVFIIAISLAIAAVPEGLPAVVTISLALGMREMIQRHANDHECSNACSWNGVRCVRTRAHARRHDDPRGS